jgi:predicted aldo/keto reductase-like oxidoreductase
MHYRRFGRTQFQFSAFSLGTMRYLTSEEVAYQTIERAIALGINHIETARGYGSSERYLGLALQTGLAKPRDQIYITSKLPPTPDPAVMERGIETSLQTLGIDYLDCLAIHGLNTWEHLSWIEAPNGCMKAVWQAVADGRIRQVGFSTHAPLEVILRAIATDQFAFVNLHYNLFFQRHSPALDLAQQKDMGVFIISPADKAGMLYTPPETLVDLCQPFSPLELNYRFLLSDRRITTLSIGPAQPAELDPMQVVADRDDPLTTSELDAIERLHRHQATVLGSDRCSQCYACLPCPEQIHIPEVLRLRNLAIAYDMTTFGKYRYAMFENAGHWFPGRRGDRCTDCGDCLPHCPEQLEIPNLLRDAHDRLSAPPRRRLWDS